MTPEGELKKRIREYLESRGAFWSNVSGGAYSKPGDPDIVACYRRFYIAIEAKSDAGRQSNVQKQREAEIRRTGGIYMIARSVEEVGAQLDRIDLWWSGDRREDL